MTAACAAVEPRINLSFVESELSLVGFTESPAGIKTNAGLPRELFSPYLILIEDILSVL
jgi:hypothetical protein